MFKGWLIFFYPLHPGLVGSVPCDRYEMVGDCGEECRVYNCMNIEHIS